MAGAYLVTNKHPPLERMVRFYSTFLAGAKGSRVLAAARAGSIVSARIEGLLVAAVIVRIIMTRTNGTRAKELRVLIDHQVVGSIRMAS